MVKNLKVKLPILVLASALLIILEPSKVIAQSAGSETIRLVNGKSVVGEIVEIMRYDYVRVKLSDNVIITIPYEEIRKITRSFSSIGHPLREKKGLVTTFEMGFNLGRYSFNDQTVKSLSIHLVNSYQFSNRFMTGFGVGYDDLLSLKVLPVYGSVRGDIINKVFTPTYQFDIGYGFAMLKNYLGEARGGMYLHPGLGFKYYSESGFGMGMGIGYKLQSATMIYKSDFYEMVEIRNYRKFTIRTFFYF